MNKNKIIESVNEYYTNKVNTHGATPKGVDWNGTESQELRFKTLLQMIKAPQEHFSLLDYGCGYGAMYEFMKKAYPSFLYTGYDISEAMIDEGKKLYNDSTALWEADLGKVRKHDYVIASGVFNIRLENSNEHWKQHIFQDLEKLSNLSEKGFAFNLLTALSDKEYMKDYLFYADPGEFVNYCLRNFSRKVDLSHSYPLFEFSIFVYK